MKRRHSLLTGRLVTLPLPGKSTPALDGFWVTGPRKSRHLVIFVHGMGSNFYKSRFKKAWMQWAPPAGWDVFSFNNRGCESGVADERFRDCLMDLDSAMAFARDEGYRVIVLLGHSTGCQKITYYAGRRAIPELSGLILAALGDDLAIAQRDLGSSYPRWLTRARQLVAEGKGDTRLPPRCLGFSARRFLSAADPRELEANLFRLDGPLRRFQKITLPVLAVFPEKEQFACIPVTEAAARLRAVTRSEVFTDLIISDADHSFHGRELACVRSCLRWMNRTLIR